MQKDKVSEKVIWENYNPSEDPSSEHAYTSAQTPAPVVENATFVQHELMFCWKCKKTIPI